MRWGTDVSWSMIFASAHQVKSLRNLLPSTMKYVNNCSHINMHKHNRYTREIPSFVEKWDPFLYQSQKFKQNFLKISHYFPKLLSFQAKFGYFGIRFMKLGLFLRQFQKILKIWPMFIPVFALNKGSSLYQEADFDTHFSGTSPNRPLY